jgi:hypothetical protein
MQADVLACSVDGMQERERQDDPKLVKILRSRRKDLPNIEVAC